MTIEESFNRDRTRIDAGVQSGRTRPVYSRSLASICGWIFLAYLLFAICYLGFGVNAKAGDILRGGTSGKTSTPATSTFFGGNQAAMAALQNNANEILSRAAEALKSAQALQQAARNAALAGSSNIPNGLITGGLQVATGKNAEWQGAKLPTQSVTGGQTTVTIQQTAPQAILNWQTFNVGKNTTAYFNQSAGGSFANTWVALNRILDPSGNPSQILGSIKAQGQVYLINQNGVIFSGTSQVNVSSLLAAAAMITDTQFTTSGIYSTIANSVYQPSFTGSSGPVIIMAGAQLTTNAPLGIADRGGSIILLGASVENDGSITTANGQTLLAAGKDFNLLQGYSIAPANSSSGNLTATTLGTEVAVNPGGIAVNTGLIQATTGDITMVGQQVTQAGVVISTSSVGQRGTIHLLTPTVDPISGRTFPNSNVTLAPGSVTLIEPDSGSGTALNPQQTGAYTQQIAYQTTVNNIPELNATPGLNNDVSLPDRIGISRIEITTGGTVDFASGSLTSATAGQIAVSAGKRIFVGTSAELDVSGLVNVLLPMSANNLAVNVQGFELRDDPLNRDPKLLNNSTVYVDLGQLQEVPASSAYPTNRFYTAGGALEVSGALNNVGHSIDEWSTIGGSITLSANQVVAQTGSVFNIAGGSIQYQAGYIKQSYFIGSDGRIYNVNTAPAGIAYVGVFQGFTVNHPRWNVTETYQNVVTQPSEIYRPSYTVGSDAGTLAIDAPTSIFGGTIYGGTIDGAQQNGARPASVPDPFLLPQTTVPINGSLAVGVNYPQHAQAVSQPITTSTSNVDFANGNTSLGAGLTPTTPLAHSLLNTNTFSAPQISSVALGGLTVNVQAPADPDPSAGLSTGRGQGYLTISAPLVFADGAQVSLTAANVDISGGITAPDGSVSINTLSYQVTPTIVTSFRLPRPIAGITLEAGATIDTQGLWTNAFLDPLNLTGEAFINGGNVTLTSNQGITLATESVIDTSSGGAVLPNRETLNGAGGNITILADQVGNVIHRPQKNHPLLQLTLSVAQQVSSAPLILNGTLRSFGVKAGGALSLQAYSAAIGDSISPGAPSQLVLPTSFFGQGFSSYTVNGLTSLTVAPGANINVTEPVYQITSAVFKVPTGTDPATALGSPLLMPVYLGNPATAIVTQRPGASLTLESGIDPATRPTTAAIASIIVGQPPVGAFGGSVEIGLAASIVVDPNQSVTIQSGGQITVNGAIRAPAGTITIVNNRQLGGLGKTYDPGGLSIWLGSNTILDVAGNVFTAKDEFGRTYGVVQNGGSITLGSQGGLDSTFFNQISTDAFVIIRPGALLDVSGASAVFDPLAGTSPEGFNSARLSGVSSAPVLVATNGGSITMSSYDGIFNDGTMVAFAGGTGAAGGTLSVILESPIYTLNQNAQGTTAPGPQETEHLAIPNRLNVPRTITIGQGTARDQLPAILQPGQDNPDLQVGQAYVSADAIGQSGFANVSLYAGGIVGFSGGQIAFIGKSILRASESITLTAPYLVGSKKGASTQIIAPYVKLSSPVTPVPPNGGTAPFYVFETGLSKSIVVIKDFAVVADLIDVQGMTNVTLPPNSPNIALPLESKVSFYSSEDIRFVAPPPYGTGKPPSSSVTAADSISLIAAQIYPATGVTGSITATDTINIGRVGDVTPALPYSVFGTLSLSAATIEQGGVLRAPLGSIVLTATPNSPQRDSGEVDLLSGSITSVSANGLTLPYGGTTDGVVYTVNGSSVTFPSLVGNLNSVSPGAGHFVIGITINAVSVSGSNGSLLDLSGGGTLTGAGFISGRGGSVDVLSTPLINQNPTNTFSSAGSTVYAILPGAPNYAPLGATTNVAYSGGVPGIGQQITIPTGVPGLAPGVYTLLPSNYALLPGAFRVELGGPAPLNQPPVTSVSGGTFVVNIYDGIANTGIQSRQPLHAVITPGTAVRDDSLYDEESYSTFASAQAAQFNNVAPLLPVDAKTLVLNFSIPTTPTSALTFNGTANFNPGPGGVSGNLMVEVSPVTAGLAPASTNLLEITGPGAIPTRGFVSVSAGALDAFGAPNLFIGSFLASSSGSSIVIVEASASQVVFRTGAIVTGAQVIVAASDVPGFSGGITLETGSAITTLGGGSPGIDSSNGYLFTNGLLTVTPATDIGSSVLAVSNGSFLLTPTALPNGFEAIGGPVNINAGATIYSEGSIGFATGTSLNLSSQVNLGARLIDFALTDINIGSDTALAAAQTAGTLPNGLSLGLGLFDQLIAGSPVIGVPALQNLVLSASQSINFYGSLDVVAPNLQLVFDTPALYGAGTSKDIVAITANQVVWNGLLGSAPGSSGNGEIPVNTNPGPVIPGGPGTGAGTLNIVANQIVFGYSSADQPQNQIELSRLALGFSNVTFTAQQEITANNKGSVSVYLAQTTVPGSYTGGNLTLVTPLLTGAPGSVLSYTTGGTLTLTTPAGILPTTAMPDSLGAEINLTGNTITDSTSILAASGKVTLTATGDLNLNDGSRIDVSGLAVTLFDQQVPTFGGDVILSSSQGSITQTALSVINVSANGNNAGSLTITATGTSAGQVTLGGMLLGSSTGNFNSGSFDVSAQNVGDFTLLNQVLDTGGFFWSRSFDIKQGSVLIAAGTTIKAHNVDISVDNGSLVVSGLIDASGMVPGSIRLSSSGNLELKSTGVLDVHSTVLQVDSYGQPIDAENRGTIELTVTDGTNSSSSSLNNGTGVLLLDAGATINMSSPDGIDRGDLELNAPRTGLTSGNVRIQASGPLKISGAQTIAVNAFWTYAPTDPNGTIVQSAGTGVPTGAIILDQVNQDSAAFITNAESNGQLSAALQSALAGLTAYSQAFHLRPGVEIVSATPTGNLTVQGDLDLSLYRYASVNPSSPLTTTYGSGEPGVLVLRAGGNLTVNGSITDGFGQVPGPNPDDNGWVLNSGLLQANLTLPAGLPQSIVLRARGTAYPATNVTLNYGLPVGAGNVIQAGVSLPTTAQPISLSKPVKISSSFIATGTITSPSGQILFTAGQTVPASPTSPYTFAIGTVFGPGSILPFPITINAVTWPAGSSLAAFSPVPVPGAPVPGIRLDPKSTLTLTANDLIPAGTVLAFASGGSVNLRPLNSNGVQGLIYPTAPLLGPGLLSWSLSLVSGADVAAADSRVLLAPATLNGSGNLILSDLHIAVGNSLPDFSVIRTGTGNLDLLAGGNFEEQSPYGIYTAGADSSAIPNGGLNLYNPTRSPGSYGVYANMIAAQLAGGYQAFYPTGGGDVFVSVGENLLPYTWLDTNLGGTNAAVGSWLWRSGGGLDPTSNAALPAAWWINFGTYLPGSPLTGFTGFGTLGGGNLTIQVANNAGIQAADVGSRNGSPIQVNISQSLVAAVGATGRVVGTSIVETGGGDLTIKIGESLNPVPSVFHNNDLDGGEFTQVRGTLQIQAGSIGGMELSYGVSSPTDPVPTSPFVAAGLTNANSAPIYGSPVVVLGDAVAQFETRGDLALGGVDDAGRVFETVAFQGSNGLVTGPIQSWFTLWRPQTELDLLSAGGNLAPINLSNNQNDGSSNETNPSFNYLSYFYPPILKLASTDGSIYLGAPTGVAIIEQASSPYSQLEVFAKNSIYADALAAGPLFSGGGPVTFALSGGSLSNVATPFNPAFYGNSGQLTNVSLNLSDNASTPLGSTPIDALFVFGLGTAANGLSHFDLFSRIYAGGDIIDAQYGAVFTPVMNASTTETVYLSAGPVQIRAGNDIINFGSPGSQGLILNNSIQDVSVVSAGGNILYANVAVAGPGNLEVSAGGNLYQNQFILDQQAAIESIGFLGSARTLNPNGGTSITVLAGVGPNGPDFNQLAALYLNPANLADPSVPLQNQPGKVVQTYQDQLYAWLQTEYGYTGTEANELAYFDALSPDQRSVFLLQVYFSELNLSGLEHNDPTSRFFQSYLRGERAIAALFPGPAANYNGSITLFGGAGIRTDFGGGIDILVPGGQTIVGVQGAQPPPTAGILTQGSGDINLYSEGSVLLGQSRILTTFGGSILIWSATGDINAGIGAKGTVIFAPPGIVYDEFADILLSPTVPSSGAGIGTLAPIPQVPPGNVNLIAPVGTIDLGEAGVRASGNANLAARVIANAANITVAGKTTGLPTIVTPNVAAITAASNAVGSSNSAAQDIAKQQAASANQQAPESIIIVEVLGYGGGE